MHAWGAPRASEAMAFRTVGSVALVPMGNMLTPRSLGHGYVGVAVSYGRGGRLTIGQRHAGGA